MQQTSDPVVILHHSGPTRWDGEGVELILSLGYQYKFDMTQGKENDTVTVQDAVTNQWYYE